MLAPKGQVIGLGDMVSFPSIPYLVLLVLP